MWTSGERSRQRLNETLVWCSLAARQIYVLLFMLWILLVIMVVLIISTGIIHVISIFIIFL
jgi:hypothetical protein